MVPNPVRKRDQQTRILRDFGRIQGDQHEEHDRAEENSAAQPDCGLHLSVHARHLAAAAPSIRRQRFPVGHAGLNNKQRHAGRRLPSQPECGFIHLRRPQLIESRLFARVACSLHEANTLNHAHTSTHPVASNNPTSQSAQQVAPLGLEHEHVPTSIARLL